MIEFVVLIILFIIILYFLMPKMKKEKFNNTFYDSLLDKDMDYIKNNKGYTLDDYILYDYAVYGKPVESSIRSSVGKTSQDFLN